jgi:hypothetical protein
MGFDEGERQTLIQPRRWGTKVNFGIVLAVIVFLGFGVFAICWTRSHQNNVATDIQRKPQDNP